MKPLRLGLAELERVNPVTYRYNGLGGTTDNGKEHVGVIAQELEAVLPMMVSSARAKLHKDDSETTDIKVVDPSDFTFLLINAVKGQQKTIEEQNARISKLESAPLRGISAFSTGIGGLAVGLVPIGLVAAQRRRKKADNDAI